MIEFTDYECPFCAQHARTVLLTLREEFVKQGKVRYAISNFPLSNHSNAKQLAISAICAGQQNQYWAMHDELFRALPKTTDSVLALAQGLNLKTDSFLSCLSDRRVSEELDGTLQHAQGIGVEGTPTFVIGPVIEKERIRVNSVIVGAQPIAVFEAAINEEISKLGQ
jgi:protein-disulfide isomerase